MSGNAIVTFAPGRAELSEAPLRAKLQEQGCETLVLFVGEEYFIKEGRSKAPLASDSEAEEEVEWKRLCQAIRLESVFLKRAARTGRFKGKYLTSLEIFAGEENFWARLLLIGIGPKKERATLDFVTLGGYVFGQLRPSEKALISFDWSEGKNPVEVGADFYLGVKLRAYNFDQYKTKSVAKNSSQSDSLKEETPPRQLILSVQDSLTIDHPIVQAAEALNGGIQFAKDLVNEPPNVLWPEKFMERLLPLQELGLQIIVLNSEVLTQKGFGALIAAGQGSYHKPYVVVLSWNGGSSLNQAPIAFLGKGVCFDSGGISIKPAANMEDMKGDMAGAACVVGLLKTLAQRKAKLNVIGAVGLIENMPGGGAQRPGDIVRSLSGQTIEIVNTDAEGRLVLADLLWYVNETYRPCAMIDLATLTGAVLVALGQEYAGLVSNNDSLAEKLSQAGQWTGEKVWRLPLHAQFDKMIDSKIADMKNAGGRYAGTITAAHFLQRYVQDCPWAHLDIAGTAFGVPETEINKTWASGWGVRLLNRFVADHYEKD